MSQKISIVMYHYVREPKRSRYPAIHALKTARFRSQIEFFQKKYNLVTAEEVLGAAQTKQPLPPKAMWLTFDDGYADHFTNVFPFLNEKKIQGTFFVPAKAVKENELLDVNKIHFILACAPDKKKIVEAILDFVRQNRIRHRLRSDKEYAARVDKKNRFDDKNVIFIKSMLQKELPGALRARLIDALFRKYVSADEKALAKELYMDTDQIR